MVTLKQQLAIFEQQIIEDMYEKQGGNQYQTARILGMSRTALIYKLKKYKTQSDLTELSKPIIIRPIKSIKINDMTNNKKG